MSSINIKRAIEHIRATTSIYTPVVEMIVNAIQAIESSGRKDGKIVVRVLRSGQIELGENLPDIDRFAIEDNGVGFHQKNRDSFDRLYSEYKIEEGGKGYGRLTCLKYFEDLHIDSIFAEGDGYLRRRFSMGKEDEFIIGEKVEPTERTGTVTVVHLEGLLKKGSYEKKLSTLARTLVEKLLPYFITKDYACPQIILTEQDESESINLNSYFTELSDVIKEIAVPKAFALPVSDKKYKFTVRVFKFLSPKSQKSKISLVAHKREVTTTPIHTYIREFIDDFYEKDVGGNERADRNYIVKAYVFGTYLDANVSVERAGSSSEKAATCFFPLDRTI